MTELFHQLLDWVALHPYWAGIIIFLVAMGESLAIVGLIVPGVVIMFGIGALVATGAINFWTAFIWAVAGAVTGDGLSFWLGIHLRDRVNTLWPFNRHPQSLEQGIRFFEKYGGKSVAIGRFFGPVRAVIPLVAGMMNMPPWRFVTANVASALLWAPAYLLPGIVFGASLELASQVAFRLVVLILLLVLLIWFTVWVVRLIFRLASPHATAWLQGLLNWSRLHPSFTEIASALADPKHPESRGLAILATLLIIAAALFAVTLGAALRSFGTTGVDATVFQAMQSLRTPWADHLMLYITRLGDSAVVLALIGGVLLFLGWQRHWRPMVYWLTAAGFGLFASVILKYGLQIPRPPAGIEGLTLYSFPSGHVLRTVVLYGFLAVMIARAMRPNWRWLAYSLAGLVMLLMAVSRLYLGAHWMSDVVGSLTLGLAWVSLLGIAYHRHTAMETHWLGLTLFSAALIASAAGVRNHLSHTDDLARYTPSVAIAQMPAADWRQTEWRQLPALRKDTRNDKKHPLNIQYAGTLETLQAHLEQKGWQPAEMVSLGSVLKLLSPKLELDQLPLLPQVHDGRHESLTLVKDGGDGKRYAIRLWSAHVTLTPNQKPLWIGNVSELKKGLVMNLFTYPETSDDFSTAFSLLEKDSSGLIQQRPPEERKLLLLQTQ